MNHQLSKRKIVTLIIIVLAIIGLIGLLSYLSKTGKIKPWAAGTGATLSLNPSSGTYEVGQTFNVDIVLNTNSRSVDDVDIFYLNYDRQVLEVQDADTGSPGVQIKTGTIFSTYTGNNVDTTNGKIAISGLIMGGSYNGTGIFATVNFKVIKNATTSTVTFNFTPGATNDTNVVEYGTYTDILETVVNGSYNLIPPLSTINVTFKLQGRSNHTTTGTNLKIYPTGQTTPILDKTDVATDSNGNYSFTYRLPAGNYDFRLKAPNYLSRFLIAKAQSNPLNLDFGILRAGDFDNNNLVNGLDFARMNAKWFSTDAIMDLNQDNIINGIDFSILNTNWFVSGE